MRSALFNLASFASGCLLAPAIVEHLPLALGSGIATAIGYFAARSLPTMARKLQSEEPPGQERCLEKRTC